MNEPLSVRERIKMIQRTLVDGKPAPALAREFLVALTALSGNVADEVRAAESDYRTVLLTCLESEQKANRAKMRAEASPQYGRYREARDTAELVKQLIISCRAYVRSLDEELRLAR